MATRCQFENVNDIGVFAKLTNAYCMVALGGTLLRQGGNLRGQQRIGALQLGMAHQQALNALGDLVDVGLIRHRLCIVG